MMSITSTRYLSNVDWLQDVVQGTDLILCGVSALEYLELFNGYVNESKIQVYAQNEGQFDNIEYHIVNSFDDIEYLNFDGVLCTTVNQTINDMLSDYDNIDELAFLEALSNYYFAIVSLNFACFVTPFISFVVIIIVLLSIYFAAPNKKTTL